MAAKKDLIGFKYHRLTVVAEATKLRSDGPLRWLCQCDCGSTVEVVGGNLKNGHTKSCGCLKIEEFKERVTTHGLSRQYRREHQTWKAIHQRCQNPNVSGYDRYGGRGITVSPEWDTFDRFLEDMGPSPGSSHSIERRDNDGPYSPDNCYWSSKTEQANNRRTNRMVTAFGETASLAVMVRKYAERLGLKYATVQRRLNGGWSAEKALTTTRFGKKG